MDACRNEMKSEAPGSMRAIRLFLTHTAMATALVAVVPALGIPSLGGVAFAETVGSVVVRGNRRIETETIRSYITVKPGRSYAASDVDESLRALYATGLFSDVKIAREGGALVVAVVENPIINKVAFEGNKRLNDEQLGTVAELKSRSFLSQTKLQSDVQRLLEVYRRSGRYRATVEPKIIDLPESRVNLVFEIDEGDKTAVSRIDFVGNKAFSDGRLRDLVKTRETGLMGFLRSTDTYDPDRLNSDQELIRRYYLKNGYADFRVVSASADLDRDRNVFFVTFTVDEGDQYRLGDVDVQSSLSQIDPASMKRVLRTKPGDVYDADAVEKTIEDLVVEASKNGYAFAQVRPRAVRDYATKTISITYYVDEGSRVYIDRINIRGNSRTRDYVIRREFDLLEGDAYNRSLVNRAERRLKALGYFKEVKITTEPSATPDRVIVNVDLEEQSTGEIGFGAGYSTTDGVLGDVSIGERNFLGRGQYVRASVQRGASQSGYSFSFTEPYFLGQRIAAGFDIFRKVYEAKSSHPFDESTTGGAIRATLPITEKFSVGASWSVYQRKIEIPTKYLDNDRDNGEASLAYKMLVGADGKDSSLYSVPSINFVWNSLDSMQFPRDGIYAKLQFDFAGAGGDVTYLKTTAEARYYKELSADWGLIGMLRGKAGYINGLGDDVRVIDNFTVGGETIRGFASNGIGPRDMTLDKNLAPYDVAIGGTGYWAATAELNAPIPGLPDEFGLYAGVFADVGMVFGVEDSVKAVASVVEDNTVRSSAGVSIIWRSPFGPIRGDFALPITKGKYDETQVFRFSGGASF
jgi:outer membrane protein insertion porin family